MIIGAIVSAVVGIGKALGSLGLSLAGLSTVCNSMLAFGKALGVIESPISAEELGDRALQADAEGIKPEDFPSYAEYVKRVESFDADPLKSQMYSEQDKLIKGAELAAGVSFERFASLPMENFFHTSMETKDYYTPNRMQELGNLARESEQDFGEVVGYLTGTEKNDEKISDAIDKLIAIEKELDSNTTDRDALKTVLQARPEEVD